MNYQEIFCSIQGEGTDTGLPCIFIRLFGCPFKCLYCDQPQGASDCRKITMDSLIAKVRKFKGVKNVCITGGEPLIHEETIPLAQELLYLGYNVSIETSGCIPIENVGYKRSFKYVMDVKCPCSGIQDKNVFNNLLSLQMNDEVKFVVESRKDYDFMCRVLKKYPTCAKILISPMFDTNGVPTIGHEIVDWILKDKLNVRVQVQLHKVLGVK